MFTEALTTRHSKKNLQQEESPELVSFLVLFEESRYSINSCMSNSVLIKKEGTV